MRLRLGVIGDPAAIMAAELAAGEKAVTAAMRAAGDGLKADWRDQTARAGLGPRLARTIRAKHYPRGTASMNAAAVVWTKAPRIIGAFESGVTIRSKDGFFLAIPTDAAGRGPGGRRLTPGQWERRTGLRLRFVYRPGRPGLLVADRARINKAGRAVVSRAKTGRGQVSAPIFVLVPQARLRKRLDLNRPAARWAARLPNRIVAEWEEIAP